MPGIPPTWRGDLYFFLLATLPPSYVLLRVWHDAKVVQNSSLTFLILFPLTYFYLLSRSIAWFTSPLRHLPRAPNEIFLLGNARDLTQRPPGPRFLEWAQNVPNEGFIVFQILFYFQTRIMLTKPETIMEVLNAHSYDWEKPSLSRKFLRSILGRGLVGAEGKEHKMQRKSVTPAFSGRHINDLVPLFWRKSLDFTNTIAGELRSGKQNIEISAMVHRVTLDIIGAAGIGKDFNSLKDPDNELARTYDLIMDPGNKGNMPAFIVTNMLFPQWILRRFPIKIYRDVANASLDLRRIMKGLLAEKKRAMALKSADKDIISIIMRSGDFSDDYLTDQLLTFLAAGHETTASALTWTVWLLCTHPDVQERLRAECTKHLSHISPSDITASALDSLPYLAAIVSETFRLYPTVPLTVRQACRRTVIGSLPIPKGTVALICPWAINRLPSIWGEDADKFKPERWIEGPDASTGGAKTAHGFITFLHGPRSCIGQGFSRSEMKCLLATFVMRFSMEMANPDEKVTPDGVITIKPRNGLLVRLTELKTANE